MFRAFSAALLVSLGALGGFQQARTTPRRPATSPAPIDTSGRINSTDSSSKARSPATSPPVAGQIAPATPAAGDSAGKIVGRLRLADGRPASGAMVIARFLSDTQVAQLATRADTGGQFQLDSLPIGRYALSMQTARGDTATMQFNLHRGIARADAVLAPAPEDTMTRMQAGLTIACLLLYALALLGARWNHIARSVHSMLDRQITALETRLDTEVESRDQVRVKALRDAVVKLRGEFNALRDRTPGFFEVFFWSRGRENSTWVVIHEIERQMAAFLAPREHVDVYLRSTEAELRGLNTRVATSVANTITAELAKARPSEDLDPRGAASCDLTRKALLGRASAIIYDDRDTGFSTLMEWQNKSGWLILAAIIIMGFLVVSAGHAVLLLAGAAGGFMSRLARALKREDVPLDYGASWTTLFLSPLLGALAGWFGIALIELASSPSLNLLGSAFQLVEWDHPSHAATLAIAFALGFSERLFDAIVGAVEKHAGAEDRARRAPDAGGGKPVGVNAAPADGAAPAGGAAPAATPPQITGATRVQRPNVATGTTFEVLEVHGSRFATGAELRVNGEQHAATIVSDSMLDLPLTDADVTRIEMAGHFQIVVVNPGGLASPPFGYTS